MLIREEKRENAERMPRDGGRAAGSRKVEAAFSEKSQESDRDESSACKEPHLTFAESSYSWPVTC